MVYSTRRFVVCLSVCHFVLVFFGPFGVAITSLGERGGGGGDGGGCGLWLWRSLDFLLPFFIHTNPKPNL